MMSERLLPPIHEARLRVFAAAADRILPGEHGPGASRAGVAGYLTLCSQAPAFSRVRTRLEEGLDVLQTMAQELYRTDFAECSAVERDQLLLRMQRIPHQATQRFFATLVRLTLAGFLCDPVHGGNRDGIGWLSIGVWFDRRGGAR
jgi:gluconate 2-dehydrogenase gamma chain